MTDIPEEWVGFLRLHDRDEFVKLNGPMSVPGNVSLDRPNHQIFALPVAVTGEVTGELVCDVVIGEESWRLSGTLDGDVFAGAAACGEHAGEFELRRVAVWETQRYRALSAQYGLDDGRCISVHVNCDGWLGAPVMFYAEEDRFVRLYPGFGRDLVSERLELFTLTTDGSSIEAMRFVTDQAGVETRSVRRLASWTDEHVVISGPDGSLAGTVMLPPGPGPHPAIVLIHGASGGLRDFYRAFAEQFVHQGMAAVVYDRRGHGDSTGNSEPTFEEKSYDAEAWVDYLQSRSDMRPDRVGVWGFSNGTWVAPLVAARRPDVAFVAVIGASGTTAVETEIHRRIFDLREQGISEEQLAWVAELWGLVYSFLQARELDPPAQERLAELMAQVSGSDDLAHVHVQRYAAEMPFLGPLPPYRSYAELVGDLPNHAVDSDSWTTDPVTSYRAIDVPVLFLVGEHDANLPALYSAQRVSQALDEMDNHQATVLLFPNTGHGMNVVHLGADSGMTSEEVGYRLHHFRFGGGFIDIVSSWARAQVTR